MRRSWSGKLMKKTQAKDAIRNIKKQTVSYLSVVCISALAVLTYLGIHYASTALDGNGNEFYRQTAFRDIEITSTYMLTQDDLEAIRMTEGVLDVEAGYRTPGKVIGEELSSDVMVVSLNERINTPVLTEGHMPENPDECVIEYFLASMLSLEVGDTIEVIDSNQGMPLYLTGNEFTVSGIVQHPDHASRPNITPGSHYVIVLPEVFDMEALHGSFMTAQVRVDGADAYDIFSDEYIDYVTLTDDRLEALADVRAPIRYEEIAGEFQSQIDDASSQLDDARSQLDDGWAQYEDGLAQAEDAEAQLIDARAQLDDGWAQLGDAWIRLEDGRAQLDDARAQLQDARAELDAAAARLAEGRAQIDDAQVQLDYYGAQIEEGRQAIADAEAQIASGRAQLISGYMQLEDAKTQVRTRIYQAILSVLGPSVADSINWASPATSVDVDNPGVSACYMQISDHVTVDLNNSLGDNIFAIIASTGIPEENLRAAYEAVKGEVLVIIDDEPVLQAIVRAIADQYNSVDSRYNEYASAAATWDTYHWMYIDGINQYNARLPEFEAALALYNEKVQQFNEGLAQYNDAYAQYEAGEAQYADGLARYNAGEAEYNSRLAEYYQGMEQLEDGETQYEDGLAQLEQGREELERALPQLEDGEAQYAEGQEKLEDAISRRDQLKACHWVVLTPEGNASYIQIRTDIKNVADMGATMAFVFILVGALVIYATTGRIIEEQRRLVGATKAFGFFNREILAKYLMFGVTGTMTGAALGVLVGYTIIQFIFLHVYGRNYVYGKGHFFFNVPLTCIVAVGAIVLSSVTVWFACTHLIRCSAITLMQDSLTGSRHKKSARSGRSKGTLYGRMIFLNMLADKKRVIVTIMSIAGCCTLLVAGMSLNFSVNNAIEKHYDTFEVYGLKIKYDPVISETVEEDIAEAIEEYGADYIIVRDGYNSYEINDKLSAFELVVGDLDELQGYLTRRDVETEQIINDNSDGLWIFTMLSERAGINNGDTIRVFDAAMDPHDVTVAGVFNQYIGQYVIMSPQTYTETFGEDAVNNTFLVNIDEEGASDLAKEISEIPGYMSSVDSASRRAHVKDLASVLDYISLLFIVVAAMMAYFILLNLVNMYINQKKLELTILRVNGFTVKETIKYVSLEIVVSTILGIIIGLVLGSQLAYKVVRLLESMILHFDRSIQYKAWVIAAIFTVFFTAAISAWALRKVKHLKLTDVSAE